MEELVEALAETASLGQGWLSGRHFGVFFPVCKAFPGPVMPGRYSFVEAVVSEDIDTRASLAFTDYRDYMNPTVTEEMFASGLCHAGNTTSHDDIEISIRGTMVDARARHLVPEVAGLCVADKRAYILCTALESMDTILSTVARVMLSLGATDVKYARVYAIGSTMYRTLGRIPAPLWPYRWGAEEAEYARKRTSGLREGLREGLRDDEEEPVIFENIRKAQCFFS
jgi:hypothetical protein